MASYIQLHSVCLCNIRPSESKKKFVHGVYNYWMMQINHLMFPAKNRLFLPCPRLKICQRQKKARSDEKLKREQNNLLYPKKKKESKKKRKLKR